MHGWVGRLLRVDLTDRKICESPMDSYVPAFVGARGVGAKIYWEEVPPECRAFDPENRLIVVTGPATGTLAPTAGKFYIGTKSPAPVKECYSYSIISGHFGATLKFAGYDGIVTKGKASEPVYLWIHDGKAEIRSAGALWGMGTRSTYRELHALHGPKARLLVIGPAGENLCREAIISTDAAHATGIGGAGAVMGSKNLKAVVVSGTGGVSVAQPSELIDLSWYLSRLLTRKPTDKEYPSVNKSLTYYMYHSSNAAYCDGLPSKPTDPAVYFKNMGLDDPVSLMAEPVKEGRIKLKWGGCYGCPVSCSVSYQSDDIDVPSGSGHCSALCSWPPYEWQGHGKVVGIPSLLFNRYVDDLGLSLTNTCGYHFEWFFKLVKLGVLTEANTGMQLDKPWTREFIKGILEKVAFRRGIGDELAEGQERFLKKLSEGNPEVRPIYEETVWHPGYYVHWSPIEARGRMISTTVDALIQATEVRAAINKVTGHSYKAGLDLGGLTPEQIVAVHKRGNARYFGSENATDLPGVPKMWRGKAHTARVCQNLSLIMDSVTMCGWANCLPLYSRYTDDKLGDEAIGAKVYSAVTGIETSQDELMAAMDRIFNLERCIHVREGRRREHDMYPDWVYQFESWQWTSKAEFSRAMDEYYALRGWDAETGIPLKGTLQEHGLGQVADELETNCGVALSQ